MPFYIGETEAIVKPKSFQRPLTASIELTHRISSFLYLEARLLDAERLEEWLSLFTPDAIYYMPILTAVYRRDTTRRNDTKRAAHYDDNLLSLRRRVTRYVHETAWAEDPPTRSVRIISGIEAVSTAQSNEFLVHSTFTNCRGRNEADEDIMYGRREDIIRKINDNFLIASRKIYITQSVLLAKNLNIFL